MNFSEIIPGPDRKKQGGPTPAPPGSARQGPVHGHQQPQAGRAQHPQHQGVHQVHPQPQAQGPAGEAEHPQHPQPCPRPQAQPDQGPQGPAHGRQGQGQHEPAHDPGQGLQQPVHPAPLRAPPPRPAPSAGGADRRSGTGGR